MTNKFGQKTGVRTKCQKSNSQIKIKSNPNEAEFQHSTKLGRFFCLLCPFYFRSLLTQYTHLAALVPSTTLVEYQSPN